MIINESNIVCGDLENVIYKSYTGTTDGKSVALRFAGLSESRLLRDTGSHRVSASESKHHFPEVFANDVLPKMSAA